MFATRLQSAQPGGHNFYVVMPCQLLQGTHGSKAYLYCSNKDLGMNVSRLYLVVVVLLPA